MSGATEQDIARVTELLGRRPQGDFEVVLRTVDGDPVVVRNSPLLYDGTPMPTRFWLVGAEPNLLVSRLESAGCIDIAESEIDPEELAQTHNSYALERDSQIPKITSAHARMEESPAHESASSVCMLTMQTGS